MFPRLMRSITIVSVCCSQGVGMRMKFPRRSRGQRIKGLGMRYKKILNRRNYTRRS